MNTRSFALVSIAATALSLSACSSPTPEPKDDRPIESTSYYFSEKASTRLMVRYTGANRMTSQDYLRFFNTLEEGDKDLELRGYKKFTPEGRLGTGPLSGKPHLSCVADIKYAAAKNEVGSFICSPSTMVEQNLSRMLDAVS